MFMLKGQSWHKNKWSLPGSEYNPITHLEVKLDGLMKQMMRYCQELDCVNQEGTF